MNQISIPSSVTDNAHEPAARGSGHRAWRARIGIVTASLILYVLACVSPALVFVGNNGPQITDGFSALVVGWLAPLFGQFAWYANPLWLASMVSLFRWPRLSILLNALALFVAAKTLLLYSQQVPADESGNNYLTFQHPAIGFYLWLAGILTIGAGALALYVRNKKLAS